MKIRFIAILTIILFISCSDQHAGTPNTSETQNAIRVSVLNSNGSPSTFAQVRVIGVQDWNTDIRDGVLDQSVLLQTDQQGQVLIHKDSTQTIAVWIEKSGEGIFQYVSFESSDSLWTLGSIVEHRSLIQNVNGIQLPGTVIRLMGTSLSATVDSLGILKFDSIPPGLFTPVVEDTWQTLGTVTLKVQANHGVNRLDSILIVPDQLVLEDFNDRDGFGLLALWTKGNHWWIYKVDEQVQIQPLSNSEIPNAILPIDSGAFEGSSLRVRLTHDSNATESVAMIGLTLGTGTSDSIGQFAWADLRNMQSLNFWAKGNTSIQVLFKTKAVVELGDDKQFHGSITLTQEWQQYSIPFTSIVPFQNSMAENLEGGFSFAAARVQSIIFQTFDSGEFWLDDIHIEGLQALQFHALDQ